MKLMTKEIEQKFKKVGRQGDNPDPIVVVKFFNPSGGGTWYATELYYVVQQPDGNGGMTTVEVEASKMNGKGGTVVDMNFYGYASIFGDHNDEWGYFALSELQSVKGPFGLGIERDLYFDPKPISKVCPKAIGG
jgi:hypothetical protein